VTAAQRIIVEAARSLVGTPFVHAGRAPGAGIDCGGVVILAYAPVGIDLEVGVDYPVIDMSAPVIDTLGARLRPLQPGEDLQPGDVLVIAGRSGMRCHLGVLGGVSGDLTIIHAWNAAGFHAVIEQPLPDQMRRLMTHAYRLPDGHEVQA
jgi:cell wall-associated NlpC family hydrolase